MATLTVPDSFLDEAKQIISKSLKEANREAEKIAAIKTLDTAIGWQNYRSGKLRKFGVWAVDMVVPAGCYKDGWGSDTRNFAIHPKYARHIKPENIPVIMRGSDEAQRLRKARCYNYPYYWFHVALLERYFRFIRLTAISQSDPEWMRFIKLCSKKIRKQQDSGGRFTIAWHNSGDGVSYVRPTVIDPDHLKRISARRFYAKIWLNGVSYNVGIRRYRAIADLQTKLKKFGYIESKAKRVTKKWVDWQSTKTPETQSLLIK